MEEKRLIERIKSGEKDLFKYIVEKHSNYVYSICLNIIRNREDARDISQEVFYKAYKSIKTYDGEICKFSTWLYKIAYNKSIDSIRKRNSFTNMLSYFKQKPSKYDYQEHSFDSAIIKDLLSELTDEDAGLITLYYLEELSIKEICYITGETENNTKVKLHRIRKRLRTIAEEKYKHELNSDIYE